MKKQVTDTKKAAAQHAIAVANGQAILNAGGAAPGGRSETNQTATSVASSDHKKAHDMFSHSHDFDRLLTGHEHGGDKVAKPKSRPTSGKKFQVQKPSEIAKKVKTNREI